MKIEKGIPIPLPRRGMGGRPLTEMGKTVRALEPGDSLLLETEEEATSARQIARSLSWKTAQRKMRDGWRMWRLE